MSTRLVRLHNSTIEELSKYGKFGQTWNGVIEQLLQEKRTKVELEQ